MNILKPFKKEILMLIVIVLAGQILFAFASPGFTRPCYEGRIYATTGVKHKQEDLHKLNEAAHYFGQTMIGWLKFPSFLPDLQAAADLPGGSGISAHIQERQNIIFMLSAPTPVEKETLIAVKDFVQGKINEYNAVSQTEFVLTNLDYELIESKRSYQFGAMVTLIATLVIGCGLIFIRNEFK
ncbi:hypothetical protein KJ657_02070 [Patescibacteria group bacterium]|nr:hypothetical protein [Patescibacteria group bacterium]MBU1015855.1 hypothetical protein [Patescibacteria group bacterium]MBU1685396.1 hypothetical protein [Patescibacteria group bacterium]